MTVNVAVNGFGNVGQGLAILLRDNAAEYAARYGIRIRLTGVSDRGGSVVDPGGIDPELLLEAKRQHGTVARYAGGEQGLAGVAFIDNAEPQVFVEAASTNFKDAEPGWTLVRAALEQDIDVVLASKGSLALYWDELFQLAEKHERKVLFSATVGSPLPSLDIASRSLIGTRIRGFEAVVNGTTNQILTAMSEGLSYEEGVRQAQAMGIAETDPTLDVDGWDAAAKAVILANAILGSTLRIGDVSREGIRGVTADDLAAARRSGEAIKLVARASRDGGRVTASVAPERRSLRDALGRLTGDGMGMVFRVDPLGTITTEAEGSEHGGGITTAMTVLRDILNLAAERGWRD